MRYARVEFGTVLEIIELDDNVDINEAFSDIVAKTLIKCNETVECNDVYENGNFFKPKPIIIIESATAIEIYNAIDSHILACIKTKDYDSLSEVALAAVDTVFKDEAMKINDWVHECWDVQQQIKDEKIMFETLEAAIKSLPPFDI